MSGCVAEYRFCPTRKFRLDFAFPEIRLACEIEGGIWGHGGRGGRHNRGAGFLADIQKYNLLCEHGWYLLRYIPKKIDYEQIKRIYESLMRQYSTNI